MTRINKSTSFRYSIRRRLRLVRANITRCKRRVLRFIPVNNKLRLFLAFTVLFGILLFVSVIYSALAYISRPYPETYVAGINIGSLDQSQIQSTINNQINTVQVKMKYQDQEQTVNLSDLQPTINYQQLQKTTTDHNMGDYLGLWLKRRDVQLPITLDSSSVSKQLSNFKDPKFKEPRNVTFNFHNDQLIINDAQEGYGLKSTSIQQSIERELSAKLEDTVQTLNSQSINPVISKAQVQENKQQVLDVINQNYVFNYNKKTYSPSKQQIANWLTVEESTNGFRLVPNSKLISEYVDSLAADLTVKPIAKQVISYASGKPSQVSSEGKNGSTIIKLDEAKTKLADAIANNTPLDYDLTIESVAFTADTTTIDDLNIRTYTYVVEVRGAVSSNVGTFKSQASATLNDSRGWASAGLSFVEVSAGNPSDFTLLLATPDQVAAVGGICDSFYSCRVGRYVVINDARWAGATPAWNSAGGNIIDYRHMLINHETGHWLGFYHRYCGGTGQPAPVMQQQSISLQGCKFNPWPLASEINSL